MEAHFRQNDGKFREREMAAMLKSARQEDTHALFRWQLKYRVFKSGTIKGRGTLYEHITQKTIFETQKQHHGALDFHIVWYVVKNRSPFLQSNLVRASWKVNLTAEWAELYNKCKYYSEQSDRFTILDFQLRWSGYEVIKRMYDGLEKPLFGEARPRVRRQC